MIATFLGTVVRESSQLQKSDAELFEEMFLHRSAGFLDCDFRILFDFILVLPILIVTKPPKEVSPLPPDFFLKIVRNTRTVILTSPLYAVIQQVLDFFIL